MKTFLQTFEDKQRYNLDNCNKTKIEKYGNYRCYGHFCHLGKGHKGKCCCYRCGKMFVPSEESDNKNRKDEDYDEYYDFESE